MRGRASRNTKRRPAKEPLIKLHCARRQRKQLGACAAEFGPVHPPRRTPARANLFKGSDSTFQVFHFVDKICSCCDAIACLPCKPTKCGFGTASQARLKAATTRGQNGRQVPAQIWYFLAPVKSGRKPTRARRLHRPRGVRVAASRQFPRFLKPFLEKCASKKESASVVTRTTGQAGHVFASDLETCDTGFLSLQSSASQKIRSEPYTLEG